MQRNTRAAIGTLTLAVTAFFGGAPNTAQAAYVVVNADPLFGASYPGQGWSATGALYIPDACYNFVLAQSTAGSVFTFNFGGASPVGCGGPGSRVRLQDVKVSLYNAVPTNVFDVIAIDDYRPFNGPFGSLLDIGFLDGQVVGFHTTLSGFTPTNVPLDGDTSTSLQLKFSKDYIPGAAPGPGAASPCSNAIDGFGSVLCVTGTRNGVSAVTAASPATVVSTGLVLTDAQYLGLEVPEPGSLALAGSALAAAWLSLGRRRRQTA